MLQLLRRLLPNWLYDYELNTATHGDVFSFDGKTFNAKVVDVYDGDTITVCFSYRGELQRYKVRMLGYNSPEMRPPKKQANRDLEIAAAVEARDELRRLIDGKIIKLACGRFDMYGRILGQVYKSYVDINQHMIDNGFGMAYTGTGAKPLFNQKT